MDPLTRSPLGGPWPRLAGRGVALVALLAPRGAPAHVPHDPVVQAALAPDYATSGRVFGVFKDDDAAVWTVSNDGGRSFVFHGDEVVDHAAPQVALGEGDVVWAALGLGEVYRSDDRGVTWEAVGPGGSGTVNAAAASGAGHAVLATDVGVYATDDGGASWWASAPGVDARSVALSPEYGVDGVAFAGGADGSLYRIDAFGASFTLLGWPATAPVRAIALSPGFAADQTLWIGTEGEGAMRSADGGFGFEPLPSLDQPGDEAARSGQVTTLLAAGDHLFAATLLHAVFRSEDGGDTFELLEDGVEMPHFGGAGGVPDGEPAFAAIAAASGYPSPPWLLLASWMGLYQSADGGETWVQTQQATPQYVRGATLVRAGAASARLTYGLYGGGVGRIDLGSGESRVDNAGLGDPWVRAVQASPDVDADGLVLAVTASGTYRSEDGGESWERLSGVPVTNARYLHLSPTFDEDQRAWLLGAGDGSGIGLTRDAGDTWQHSTVLGLDGSQHARALAFSPDWDSDRTVWAAFARLGGVAVSRDSGDTWTWLGGQAWGEAPGLAAFRADAGTQVLVVASLDAGVLRSEDGGLTFATSMGGLPDDVRPTALVRAGDETLFLGTRRHGVFRSDDRASTWQAAPGFPGCAMVLSVAASPAYDEDSTLVVGTYRGAWLSRDGGETFTLGSRHERLEAEHPQWRWSAGWVEQAAEEDESAETVRVATAADDHAWTRARGDSLEVIATTDVAGGSFCLYVDGEPAARCDTASEARKAQRAVCGWTGPGDGWHEVAVRTVGGGTVRIDALDARRPDGVAFASTGEECDPFAEAGVPADAPVAEVPGLSDDPDDPCGLSAAVGDDDSPADDDASGDDDLLADDDADDDTSTPSDDDAGGVEVGPQEPPGTACGCASADGAGGGGAVLTLGVAAAAARRRRR